MDQLFSPEELELLQKEIPDFASKSSVTLEEAKSMLEVIRAPLPGHQIREIAGVNSKIDLGAEFSVLLRKARDVNDTSSHFRKSCVLKQAELVEKCEGMLQAMHTYSISEERGFTNWINKNLRNDEDSASLIPLSFDEHELFTKLANGIILCKMVNLVQPNTIHPDTINKGDKLKYIWNTNTNLTLAINSAASIGCCVTNIGPTDIQESRKHIILGLVWQLIRKCIIDSVTLSKHAELAALLLPGETLEDINKLKPEVLLMRWVNYQMEQAGCDRRMKNFNEDIHDSEIYSTLLKQIAPDSMKSRLVDSQDTMSKTSLQDRAQDVCKNSSVMDCGQLITPEGIWQANDPKQRNDNLHLGYVATLFNMYPAMDPPAEPVDLQAYEETLEEKTYRNWMNSLGVQPYVNHLYQGLSDGIVLLQLIEIINPGSVAWKSVSKVFDPKKEIFQKNSNCSLFVEVAQASGIKLVNISGSAIYSEEKKLVLGTCFSLMQKYLYTLLAQVCKDSNTFRGDEKYILNWANEMLGYSDEATQPLSSFRDKNLLCSKPICQVVNVIAPGTASSDRLSADNFQNAVYGLSCARKAGAKVYALPEHIVNMDGKMIMTIFVCLMIEYHTRQAIISGDSGAAATA